MLDCPTLCFGFSSCLQLREMVGLGDMIIIVTRHVKVLMPAKERPKNENMHIFLCERNVSDRSVTIASIHLRLLLLSIYGRLLIS